MKRLTLLFLVLLAFPAQGKDLILKHGQPAEYRFDAPAGENAVLFFRARIALSAPNEAWGFHVLELSLNGKELPPPLNKPQQLRDPQCRPALCEPVRNTEGRFFIKADSDWTVFNAGRTPESPAKVNVNQAELNSVFYHFAFPLKELKKKDNILRLKAILPDYASNYTVEIEGLEAAGYGRSIVFQRDFLQAVYPWTFPMRSEVCEFAGLTAARGETGTACFSVYSFGPDVMKLPGDVQVYRLDNTVIPAKLKQAENPNFREPYVPELLTPLKKGSELPLPRGTATFFVKYRGEEPGVHEIAGLPLRVRVLGFELPDPEELPVENGLYNMADGAEKQDIFPEMREYGITQVMMTPWLTPIPLKIEDGKLQADFRKFDAGLRYLQERKINRRKVFFGTAEPILNRIRRLTGEDIHGEAFQRRFREFLELFFGHADELGIEVYLSLYDEANFNKKNWKNVETLMKTAVSVPNSRMWATLTELPAAAHLFDTVGCRPARDLAVTHPFQLIGCKDDTVIRGVLSPAKKAGELRGRFHAEYDGISSYPGLSNRYVYGLRSWESELKVLMGFAFWWGSMKKPNTNPVACHYVTWPFRDKETGVRFSTVGWEALRAGIDDRRYLALAERCLTAKYGEAEAKSRLKQAVENAVKAGFSADVPDCFAQLRKELVKIIEENKL